jgi:hypothetical protein
MFKGDEEDFSAPPEDESGSFHPCASYAQRPPESRNLSNWFQATSTTAREDRPVANTAVTQPLEPQRTKEFPIAGKRLIQFSEFAVKPCLLHPNRSINVLLLSI